MLSLERDQWLSPRKCGTCSNTDQYNYDVSLKFCCPARSEVFAAS